MEAKNDERSRQEAKIGGLVYILCTEQGDKMKVAALQPSLKLYHFDLKRIVDTLHMTSKTIEFG